MSDLVKDLVGTQYKMEFEEIAVTVERGGFGYRLV
jgi:hypothetical protein